jgi:hypothetical protein
MIDRDACPVVFTRKVAYLEIIQSFYNPMVPLIQVTNTYTSTAFALIYFKHDP